MKFIRRSGHYGHITRRLREKAKQMGRGREQLESVFPRLIKRRKHKKEMNDEQRVH